MKVYTCVTGSNVFNVPLGTLFDNKSASGPRIKARSAKWPTTVFNGILEGGLETLDFEDNADGETLWVSNLQSCSAVFYLYLKSDGKHLSAALAFHSPSGTLGVKLGGRKGTQLGGPLAEAKRLDLKNVKAENVRVLMAAGTSTMSAHKSKNGDAYAKAAIEEHKDIIEVLKTESIPEENCVIYCSSPGEFGLSADGFLGEKAPLK